MKLAVSLGENGSRAAVPRKGAVLHLCGLPASQRGAGAFISYLALLSYHRYCNYFPSIVRWTITSTSASEIADVVFSVVASVASSVLCVTRSQER